MSVDKASNLVHNKKFCLDPFFKVYIPVSLVVLLVGTLIRIYSKFDNSPTCQIDTVDDLSGR
jgi:hypothetical protein